MKKIIAAITLCGFALTLAACEKTEIPNSTVSVPTANDSGSSGSGGSSGAANGSKPSTPADGSSSDNMISVPIESMPNLPTSDEPETVSGIHDLSTGNFIYNPNVTDTSNTRRYYGDFGWVNESKTLWTSSIDEKPWPVYDYEAAIAYGKAHWDDGVGLCAPFISKCITAGSITDYTESSTSITLQLLHSRLGFGQFIEYNKSDHTISMPKYARPGDVVQIYCSYEGCMIHSLLMVGTDDEGRLKAVCHNMRNSGQSTFYVDHWNDPCYDCASKTVEVFFYHFYRDDDEGLPEEIEQNRDIVLWEEKGYTVLNETYDREAALSYAKNNPADGWGYYGASHTSDILRAGNISVGYPNQSALFLQLLKSHHGAAYSQRVRADRTVILPQYSKPGDIAFVYCPHDGLIVTSAIITGRDDTGRMITESHDLRNDGKSAYKVDSKCVGCGDEIKEVIIYCFDN